MSALLFPNRGNRPPASNLVNNLLNITVNDPIFWVKAKHIAEKAAKRLEERDARLLLYPQLAIVAGDSYFLHYSILPLLRNRNPDPLLNEVLEEQRKYIATPDFSRVRTITKLSDLFSTIHAVAFTVEFARRLLEELRKQLPPEQYRQLLEQLQRLAQQQLGGQQPPQQPQQQGQQQGGQVAQGGQQQLAQQKQTAQQAGQSQQPQQQPLGQGGLQPQQGAGGQQQPQQQGGGQTGFSSSRPPPGAIVDYWPSSGGLPFLPLPSGAVGKAFKDALDAAERAARAAKDIADVVGVGKEPSSLDLLLDLTERVLEVEGAERILTLAKKTVDAMPFFVHREKERHRRLGDEVAGYFLTKNPERALPRELALPDELFFAKLAGGLLAREKLAPREGAIYVLLDKSGSMSGEKTVWARSVALALLALARRKRAKFFLRFFDTRAYDLVSGEESARLLEMLLKVESNGGTSIDTALQTAIKDLAERGLSKLTNTVIIVTDGEDEVTTTRRELERAGARLVSVMIRGSNETLEKISDQYLKVEPSAEGALKLIEVVRK